MLDYYGIYETFSEEIDLACNCISSYSCSKLGSEITNIMETIEKLNINSGNWGDSVADGFLTLKSSFVNNLNSIVLSIDSYFTDSERIYQELQTLLSQLEQANGNYQDKYKLKPKKENFYKTVEIIDSFGNTKYESKFDENTYRNAYDTWESEVTSLSNECMDLTGQIEDKKSKLNEINSQRIQINDINDGMENSVQDFTTILMENEQIRYNTIFETDGSKDSNARVVWDYLKYMGLSDAAAAGVLGNISAEDSQFDPDVYEGGRRNSSSSGYGLIQWTNYKGRKGGRRDQLFSAAAERGVEPSSLQFQCEYLWEEALDPNSSYGKALARKGFYDTSDPQEAAQIFHDVVEASADSQAQITANRCKPAQRFYNEFSTT